MLLCLCGAQIAAVAQKATAPRTVAVVVVNAQSQPPQPVPTVRVELDFLDNNVLVTEARDVTNPNGQAWLNVSEDAAQRGGLRIQVSGAANLVIYQPADGQLAVLPPSINVSMLPKGSPALLGPAQIEAALRRLSLEVASLRQQSSAPRTASAEEQAPGLGEGIAEWAQTNGFSAEQADQQVKQWAEGIEKQTGGVTAEQKGLAELALKHYADAAKDFSQASDADRQEIAAEDTQSKSLEAEVKALEAAQQALLGQQRSSLQRLIDHSEQAAIAYRDNREYHQATLTANSAEATAEAEYKKHPDDKSFHKLWLHAQAYAAYMLLWEGEGDATSQGLVLLAQSVSEFDSLAREETALGNPEGAAAVEFARGLALTVEGGRAAGAQAVDLLDQAAQAYRSALEGHTKDDATTQSFLARALRDEGERASGDKAAAALDQAVQAYRSALDGFSKADNPEYWAEIEGGLGSALADLGVRTAGDDAVALLDQAVQAYQSALTVDTKADHPQEWAGAQINLGNAFLDEGKRISGEKAVAALDQSVQAYRNALEVDTKAGFPRAWASTQFSLGSSLMYEETLVSGDKTVALLDQAVQSYRSALEVYTKAGFPQVWALIQLNLGLALSHEGSNVSGDKAAALLDQAVEAYRSALEVYTKTDTPGEWAATQDSLGDALGYEADRASGDQAAGLFDRAAQAYRSSLEVVTKADLPQVWADTQDSLGTALMDEGKLASGGKAATLFGQAAQAFQSELEARTKASQPKEWAATQYNLGSALMHEETNASGDKAAPLNDQAAEAYRSALEVYTKADLPQNWSQVQSHLEGLYHDHTFQFGDALKIAMELADFDPTVDNRMNLLEAELTGADFDGCVQLEAKLDDAALVQQKAYTSVRDVIGLACQWGAADKAGAHAADLRLLTKADADRYLTPGGWSFTGTLRFLSQSPAFASGHASWIALFTAVQNGDSAGMTAALHQLEPILQQ